METLLVIKDIGYASTDGATKDGITVASAIDTMHKGSILAVMPDGNVLKSDATNFGTNEYFQFILDTIGGGLWRSALIQRDTFKVVKELYIAPVEKVQTLTFSATTALEVGNSVGVDVIPALYATPSHAGNFIDHSTAILAGDTVAMLIVKLVALINANDPYVSATGTATTIVLTGKAGIPFNATGTMDFATYTSAETTAYKAGHGTSAQIAAEELAASAHKGNNRFRTYGAELYPQAMQTVDGETYMTYTFTWQKSGNTQLNAKGAPYNQLGKLAVPSGHAALIAILDVIFAAV